MSDPNAPNDFIPFNQSTPMGGWSKKQNSGFQRRFNGPRFSPGYNGHRNSSPGFNGLRNSPNYYGPRNSPGFNGPRNSPMDSGPGPNPGFNNRWSGGSQRNSSFESDHSNNSFRNGNNSYRGGNNSFRGGNNNDINSYLHPSMLQDPWAELRRKNGQ